MMRFKFLVLAGLLPVAALSSEPAPKDPFRDIERFIKTIQKTHDDKFEGSITSILNILQRALKSDKAMVEFYLGAFQNVRFGEGEQAALMMMTWKERNASLYQSTNFKNALRLHIMFLQSALLKKGGWEDKALDLSMKIVQKAATRMNRFRQYGFIRKPLSTSPIINMGARKSVLQGIKDWYMGPLSNITEMHRQNVIAVMRNAEDLKVFIEWENNINMEKAFAEKSKDPNEMVRFRKERLPALKWQMATDYAAFKEYRKAMDLIVAALKPNPTHPQFDRMMADLKKWLEEARQQDVKK